MPIRIFVTGGTFDKEYNEINGQLFFRDTHLPEMLSRSRHTLDVSVETLMMVDSLLMTNRERDLIAAECRKAKEDRIVIAHGTDTMPVTAKALEGQVPGKTIVLTGAMIPYTFGSSDGSLTSVAPWHLSRPCRPRLCRDERALLPRGYGKIGHRDPRRFLLAIPF